MRFRSMLACAASLALLVPAADAVAAPKKPATRVVLKAPKGGDVSYAVVQVKLGGAKGPKKAEGKTVWSKTVAGVRVAATSPAWSGLKATTKAYVVVGKVDGAAPNVRNLTFVIARTAGKRAKGSGSITFTAPGTTPATGSFWVRKVSKAGVADVFHAENAAAGAVKNWSKYLTVLRAAGAVKAAFHAIDVNGTFRDKKKPAARAAGAQAHAAAAAAVTMGGHRASPLGRKLVTLFFGTLADRDAYQALKRSTLVTDYLRKDLNNPKLADEWGKVTEALPPMVPDAYASNAKEEKRFGKVTAPRIAHTSVRISDAHNASEQAAIETPRAASDTLPGLRVNVEIRGTPNAGEVHGYQYLGVSKDSPTLVTCRASCSSFWPQGVTPHFEAVTDDATVFNGWEGCGNGTEKKGTICKVRVPEGDFPPALKLIATFTRPGATGGGGGSSTPAPQPPAPPTPAPPAPAPNGAVGKLDTAFGTNGFTLTEVGAGNGFGATGLARQSTGKIVQVGTGDPVTSIHSKVLRYTADGKLDPSFGVGGVLTLPTVVNEFYAYSVAVDAADRMVIAGQFRDVNSGDLRLGVMRLLADGSVDATFGGGGQVDLPVGTDGYVAPHGIALAADGTIYVAGSTYVSGQPAVALAALDSGGMPVSGFGTGGIVVDQPDGRAFGASNLTLTAAGLVVVGGDADGPLVARYTTGGALDPAFNGGHVLVVAPGTGYAHGSAQAAVEQADGKLVLAGYVETADNLHSCLATQRVTAAGVPDPSYGAGGTAVACEGGFSGADAVAIDGNGIYAAGHTYGASNTSVLLVRFTAAGTIDASFDGGIFTNAPAGDSRATTMLLQDGHPVLGGEALTSTSNQFLLERVVGH